MLYGHIETMEERVDHMMRSRALQDETGGFQAFIPLAFHPDNNQMRKLPAPSGTDTLRVHAVSRLMLDNIPHIKAFWIATGLEVAQTSLWFGVDDLDGTVQEEKILPHGRLVHARGDDHGCTDQAGQGRRPRAAGARHLLQHRQRAGDFRAGHARRLTRRPPAPEQRAGLTSTFPHVAESARFPRQSVVQIDRSLERTRPRRRIRNEIDRFGDVDGECARRASEATGAADDPGIQRDIRLGLSPVVVVNSLSPFAAVKLSVPVAVLLVVFTRSTEVAVNCPRWVAIPV
jgi:hypothetical protein